MKKNLLVVIAVIAASTLLHLKANAQDVATTGNVPVRIALSDVFAINLLNNQEVLFTYDDAAAYNASQTVNVADQFSITSTKAYAISVRAEAQWSTLPDNDEPLALSILQVSVTGTTLPAAAATFAAPAPLDNAEQVPLVLATNGVPALGTLYSTRYTIPSALSLLNKTAGDYTTNLTYTITAQ